MINVRITELLNKDDLKLQAHPYTIKGRLQIAYALDKWIYKEKIYDKQLPSETPVTEYDYDKYIKNYVILGAYKDEKCVGFALLERESRTRYLYIKEVRTDAEFVNNGISTKLIQHCFDKALEMGYRGIYTVTPNTNLDACKFYLNNGFRVGGLDTEYYMGTTHEGEKDIIFYKG